MYSINESNSEQSYICCRNDCGARITFSNNAISRNGRKIPLQENGLPHNCPKSHFNRGRQGHKESTGLVRKIESTEHLATIVPPEEYSGSNPKQQQNLDNDGRKLTPDQQQYADTLGPLIAKILSLVQEIHQQTVSNASKYEQSTT